MKKLNERRKYYFFIGIESLQTKMPEWEELRKCESEAKSTHTHPVHLENWTNIIDIMKIIFQWIHDFYLRIDCSSKTLSLSTFIGI